MQLLNASLLCFESLVSTFYRKWNDILNVIMVPPTPPSLKRVIFIKSFLSFYYFKSLFYFLSFLNPLKATFQTKRAKTKLIFPAHALERNQYFPFKHHFPDWVSLRNIWFTPTHAQFERKRIFTNRNEVKGRGNGWVERSTFH